MSDFRQMFPTMEEDVIEAVLRANDGAVDATIDQLLTMSIDAGNDPVTHTARVSLPEISLMHRSRKNITDKQGPYNLKLYFFLNWPSQYLKKTLMKPFIMTFDPDKHPQNHSLSKL